MVIFTADQRRQLTREHCSWGGGGDHFALLLHLSLRAETKTNRRQLALITLVGSMICKPFCLVYKCLTWNHSRERWWMTQILVNGGIVWRAARKRRRGWVWSLPQGCKLFVPEKEWCSCNCQNTEKNIFTTKNLETFPKFACLENSWTVIHIVCMQLWEDC